MTEDELITLGDFAASLFPPGRGPRVGTDGGFAAWQMLWGKLSLSLPQAQEALTAWVLSDQHDGAWDAGAFAKTIRSAALGDAGDMWTLATRWVADRGAGPTMRGGSLVEAPSLEDMERRPDRWAMIQAVKAIGFDAIRLRRPEDEGTMRAQFRKAYEEASARQVVRGVLGVPDASKAIQSGQRALSEKTRNQ